MTEIKSLEVGDIHVALRDRPADHGSDGRPPLLLLHGAVQTLSIWEAQFTALGGVRRLVAPDLRGHGETTSGSRRLTVDCLADDALALMDALEIESATVCGVSLGGMVALEMADGRPDRISSLVLANTPTSLTSTDWLRSLVDWLDPQDLLPFAFRLLGRRRAARIGLAMASRVVGPHWVGPTARRHFIEGFSNMAPEAIVATYRAIVEARPVDPASIRCPVLLMEGKSDAPSIKEQMDGLAEDLRRARMETVPGGHVASLDDPKAFNRVLVDFLARRGPD